MGRRATLAALVAVLAASGSAPAQEPVRLPPNARLPASRVAPPSTFGRLRFTNVRVFGPRRFAGLADVTNAGRRYVNRLTIGWSIVSRRGVRLDAGRVGIASLAPGETATVSLTGSRRYTRAWAFVVFAIQP